VHITLQKRGDDGSFNCKGTGTVRRSGHNGQADETAVSGRFTMRPLRTDAPRQPTRAVPKMEQVVVG
jgi:hypothetical protein